MKAERKSDSLAPLEECDTGADKVAPNMLILDVV
jgi:hypothetical protein